MKTHTYKLFLVCLALLTLFGYQTGVQAQAKTKIISINKTQGLDIVIASRKPGTDDLLNAYYSNVLGLASQHGFKLDGTFLTAAPPTKGNFHPVFISLASWTLPSGRDKFRAASKDLDYDYVAERRKIWSVFNLTQYESPGKDIEFEVSTDKVYVITSYWVDDMETFQQAKRNGGKGMRDSGGKLLLALGKGHSPNGYLYEPDVISLTEWDSVEAFLAYNKSVDHAVNDAGSSNVNQWITKLLIQ